MTIVSASSNWKSGLLFSISFFLVQLFKILKREKYFISEFKVSEDLVTISYTEVGESKSLKRNINDLKIEKGYAFNKTKTAFLKICSLDDFIILKQYETNQWKEEHFEELINFYERTI